MFYSECCASLSIINHLGNLVGKVVGNVVGRVQCSFAHCLVVGFILCAIQI